MERYILKILKKSNIFVLAIVLSLIGNLIFTPVFAQNSDYIFKLTDDEIRKAIEEGRKGLSHYLKIEEKYMIKPKNNAYMARYNKINVNTPYLHIVLTSMFAAREYKPYSFESAKKDYSDSLELRHISLAFLLFENTFNTTSSYAIGFFQNNKQIENVSMLGLRDAFPKRSRYFPNNPSYIRTVIASFPQYLIDTNIPFTIKINHITGEAIYDVYLKNYK